MRRSIYSDHPSSIVGVHRRKQFLMSKNLKWRNMRRFIIFLGLLCFAMAESQPGHKNVHELMADDEITHDFDRTRQEVLENKVRTSDWLHRQKRSGEYQRQIQVHGTNVTWDEALVPTENVLIDYEETLVYYASSQPGPAGLRRAVDPWNRVEEMVTDLLKGTSSMTSKPKIRRGIQSAVHRRFRKSADNSKSSENSTAHYDGPINHGIYKQPVNASEAFRSCMTVKQDSTTNKPSRSKREVQVPSVIYPEIRLLIDYATWDLHGKDEAKLLTYLLAFWSSVDLKFRSLSKPHIKLSIFSITIAEDPDAFSFIHTAFQGIRLLNMSRSLVALNTLISNHQDDQGDIVFAMTAFPATVAPGDVAYGITSLGAACSNNQGAIVSDNGAFSAVVTAAHELGHMFGATHDGPECHNSQHIMNVQPEAKKNQHFWSACSLALIDRYFRGLTRFESSCLFNKPKRGQHPMRQVLPGKIIDKNQQCFKALGTGLCTLDQFSCVRVWCWNPLVSYDVNQCIDAGVPQDGSICGENKLCINGRCEYLKGY